MLQHVKASWLVGSARDDKRSVADPSHQTGQVELLVKRWHHCIHAALRDRRSGSYSVHGRVVRTY